MSDELSKGAIQAINKYLYKLTIALFLGSGGTMAAVTWYVASNEIGALKSEAIAEAQSTAKLEASRELSKLELTERILSAITDSAMEQKTLAAIAAHDSRDSLRMVQNRYSLITNRLADIDELVDRAPQLKKVLETTDPGDFAMTLLSQTNFQDQIAARVPTQPVGTIVAYWGTEEPPGWKICDGGSIDISDPKMSNLRKQLGTEKLPNLQGMFLRGIDPSGDIDPDGMNRKIGERQKESLKIHVHTGVMRVATEDNGAEKPYIVTGHIRPGDGLRFATGNNTRDSTNTSGGEETRPVNVTVNWIIKY